MDGRGSFFVLSGFLIGGLLVQELLASDDIDIRRFLMRRALKIWPAYYAYILFQIIVRKHPLGSFAWQNLLNVQNYVGTSLNHTWSLAVEEQFYLVLPVVLWFCYRKHRARIPVVLAAMCFLVLVGRCIAVYWLGQPNPQWKTHARIDSLLFGVVMSWFFYSQRARFDRILKYRLALLGTSAAGLLFAFKLGLNDPLMWTVGYTANYLALGALMLLVYQYRGSLIHSKAYKALAWIGVYSYGIYLWHLSVRDPLAKVAAHLPISIRWGCLLLSQYAAAIVLGYLMTQLVEFPMLRVRERIFPRGPAALAPNRP